MKTTIKAGIIGTGKATGIAMAHLRGYLTAEDVEFIGAYNRDPEGTRAWLRDSGLSEDLCYEDVDALIRDADVISICTPNFAHVEYVKKCLEAGTHVLCEKPLCRATEDWDAAGISACPEGVVGMMDFNYRQLPGLRALHEKLASGELGRVYTIRLAMGAPRLANEAVPLEWRFRRSLSGTGAVGDFGSHALDMLCYLLGMEIPQLIAPAARKSTFIRERMYNGDMKPVENDDMFAVQAGLPGGGTLQLELCRLGVVQNGLELVAEHGMATFDLMKPDRLTLRPRETNAGYGKPQEILPDPRGIWKDPSGLPSPYIACAENVHKFVDLVREGKRPDTDLSYGYAILKTIEELDDAAVEG